MVKNLHEVEEDDIEEIDSQAFYANSPIVPKKFQFRTGPEAFTEQVKVSNSLLVARV